MKDLENYKVLVVDDELDLLQVYERYFKFLGYKYFSASNGSQAEAIIMNENIDYVICDILMPGMSGLELYEKIVNQDNCPHFIFCSGGEFPYTPPYPEKIVAFFQKPFDLPDLLAKMANHMVKI